MRRQVWAKSTHVGNSVRRHLKHEAKMNAEESILKNRPGELSQVTPKVQESTVSRSQRT